MKRILLLDDSPTIQRVVTLSFTSAQGYDVKTASNLEAAKKYLAEGRPDVLIAYVRFSGDANPDFFGTLNLPAEQILLLAESRENLEPFEKAGYAQFIRKPFHTDELKKAILAIIGDSSIQPEQISTPTLNRTPPPPTFRPATTISMEALDRTFNKQAEARAGLPPPPPRAEATFVPPPPAPRAETTFVPPPPPPTTRSTEPISSAEERQFSQPEADTQMRRVPPPLPQQPVRRETQLQPLVTSGGHRHHLTPPLSRTETTFVPPPPPPPPPPANRSQSREEELPSAAFSMTQATMADAEARREMKDWIHRELPRIARDVVREELQKLIHGK